MGPEITEEELMAVIKRAKRKGKGTGARWNSGETIGGGAG